MVVTLSKQYLAFSVELSMLLTTTNSFFFSGATPEEIQCAKDKLEELKLSQGGVKSFLNDHDDFKLYGCGTIITAVKK